jgi:uncharacterized membrane protein YgcG
MSTMRNTLNVVRYDWLGVRIGGPGASMRGQWPVLIVAALVVFGCFFAVGRLLAGESSPREGSSAAPVSRAVIPGQLQGGSPIAAVPSSIAEPPPQPRPASRRGPEALQAPPSSQAPAGEGAATEGAATEASSGSQLESAPAVERASPPQAGAGTGSSGAQSSGGATGGGGSGGGGSFDSSE